MQGSGEAILAGRNAGIQGDLATSQIISGGLQSLSSSLLGAAGGGAGIGGAIGQSLSPSFGAAQGVAGLAGSKGPTLRGGSLTRP